MSAKTNGKNREDAPRGGLNAAEKAAMKARAAEIKAEARLGKDREAGERALSAAIAEMGDPDRALATRLHGIIAATAPALMPKTWYGMPAWANQEGKVICFFQAAGKFNARYATFGFQHEARLDAGNLWPTSFALIALTPAEEAMIAALVKRAVR